MIILNGYLQKLKKQIIKQIDEKTNESVLLFIDRTFFEYII